MPMEIAILEDNEERCNAMRTVLQDRFPQYPIRFFATAAEMIRYLRLHLPNMIAIALDHDLDLIAGGVNRLFDPGTGRDVADYLATEDAVCRVVIHTTNQPAAEGMEQALRDAGWRTKRVIPYGDLEWIPEIWFPAMRNAIVRGPAFHAARGPVTR